MKNNIDITPELLAEHGLKPNEYERILKLIGRQPTLTELGIFSAMWNEHCSYKSSKIWLKTLPTQGKCVIHGPGENAGVVDIGDGQAVVFKMESHNHPSFIEPYQGAATGVGGILRDVFTMGARPIAAMNALRFGAPDNAKTKHLISRVIAGIGGYANSFGVPTVGGEVEFHERYNNNVLVNAFAAGLADTDKIFLSKAEGVGLPVVYLGAKTGRDGVGGATMASAEFGDDTDEKRPTVQVGDPFTQKCLLEACLELMRTDAVVAIQDMGAAGLTCSAVEMGAKGNLGIELDLDQVPIRESRMTPYEMMLSESQERMLMVLEPGKRAKAEEIFRKWSLDFAIIGETTDDLRFRVRFDGEEVANLPIKELGDDAPEYDRPWCEPAKPAPLPPIDLPQGEAVAELLLQIVGSANGCSRRWVYEQYDSYIQGNTAQHPGGDAGVVRIPDKKGKESTKGLAFSCDVNPVYCAANPYQGGMQAVAELWRNLTAVGARPLAATDNLNFGNPERPEIMGEFVQAIKGIGEACTVLDFPIVSGNVSLYNETNGVGILPTPAMAGIGLLDDVDLVVSIGFKAENDNILLVGGHGHHIGQSLALRTITGGDFGDAPIIDCASEKKNGNLVRDLILNEHINACHDISRGGLGLALAEMAIQSKIGATIDLPPDAATALFCEDQARYVIVCKDKKRDIVLEQAENAGVEIEVIGKTGGNSLDIGAGIISLNALCDAYYSWFPKFMGG